MGQNMVMFIGAIMSVDTSLYEAAEMDGANRWEQFKYIILPSIKTIVMLNLILSITGSLSAFEPPYVIMGGGASGTATYFIKMHQTAYVDQKVGTACAIAVNLFRLPRVKRRDQVFFVRTRDLSPDRFSHIPPASARAASGEKLLMTTFRIPRS